MVKFCRLEILSHYFLLKKCGFDDLIVNGNNSH